MLLGGVQLQLQVYDSRSDPDEVRDRSPQPKPLESRPFDSGWKPPARSEGRNTTRNLWQAGLGATKQSGPAQLNRRVRQLSPSSLH